MTYPAQLLAVFLCFIPFSFSGASPTKFEKETLVTLKDQSKFTISAGWSFDESTQSLVTPEGDVKIYLFQKPFNGDVEKFSESLWKTVQPDFGFKIMQKVSPPAEDGWEQTHQIVYEVPAKENRTVMTLFQVFKGQAYAILVNGSNSGLEKRGAQFQIVADTWRPEGMKKETLGDIKVRAFGEAEAKKMDSFAVHAMKELQVPGATIAIIQNGKVIFRKGYGVKKAGSKDKVKPETLFMIGSTTKPLTTLMLAKLVDLGQLSWETPIVKALPSFRLADKKNTDLFKIKHTACACTGMPRRDLDFVFGSKSESGETTIAQLQAMKPTTGFGETFQYSNHLVATGGYAGANVYGKGTNLFEKYEAAMNDLVFTPLKMNSSRVRPAKSDSSNLASPHSRDINNKMVSFPQKTDDMVYPVAPAGSIWSNVDDLSKYVFMELAKGKDATGQQLYSEKQIEARRTAGVKVDENTAYGLGLFIENSKGVTIIGHGGNTLGFTSDLFFIPKDQIGMIVLTNASSVNGFRNAMKQKVLELLYGAEVKTPSMVQFSKKTYREMKDKVRERVTVRSNEVKWIEDFKGNYANPDLGKIEITQTSKALGFSTERWTSDVGSAKEQTGEKLIALTSAPWVGTAEIRVQKSPKKLILDDAQTSYEFLPIAPVK